MKLTDQKFWEHRWWSQADVKQFGKVHPGIMPFHPLFEKLLPRDLSFVEVGCSPGRNLVYFHRYFNYRVACIDFAAEDLVRQTLESNGITDFEIYPLDFLEALPPKKFDVVGSFGFVEHFTDMREVLRRHVELVNEGGYVVIGVPNLRWGPYLIRLVLDRKAMKRHNLDATNCALIRKTLTELGAKEMIYSGYYKPFKSGSTGRTSPGGSSGGSAFSTRDFKNLPVFSGPTTSPAVSSRLIPSRSRSFRK